MQTRLGEREWVRRFAAGFPFVFSERKKGRHWNPQADRFRRVVSESSVQSIDYVDTVVHARRTTSACLHWFLCCSVFGMNNALID